MALPPPLSADEILTHDLINELLADTATMLAGQAAAAALLVQHTASLSAIQATQAQQGADIDALEQITDASQSPLPPPGLAQVTASQTDLTVSWTPMVGANISYLVEYEPANDVNPTFTALPTTAATQATITGLTAGTDYAVRVSTVAGTLTGPPGTPVIFTTVDAPAVPIAPVMTTLGTPTTTSVTVRWNAVANATQYEAGFQTVGVWAASITTLPPTTQATFTGLTTGTAYTFQVRGDNGATLGSLSAPLVAVTSAAGPTPPAQVTGGVASNATTTSIDYTWTAFPASGTPPADPGISAPALTIAPGSVAYDFSNLAFSSTATQANAGSQSIYLHCTKGQLSFTPVGTVTVNAGAQNSIYVGLRGIWDNLIASAATITYRSPAALVNDTDSISVELWVTGSTSPQTATIPITISVGAVTSETGGYNPTGAVSYVPLISGDLGATWTAFPKQPGSDNNVTFSGLASSHLYQMRVHAVSLANVAGIDSTVTSLSTAAVATVPGVIGDPSGTTAVRMADFASSFGTNCYPNNAQDGVSKANIGPCIDYIFGGTGFRPILRFFVYGASSGPEFVGHYQDLIASNRIRAAPVANHFSGTADGGGVAYIATHLPVADFAYVEGPNEPNTSGFGLLTPSYTLSQQQVIYNAAHPRGIKVALPSVLFRSSDQITWWGGNLAAALAASDYSCTHHYPNHGCYSGNNELINWTDPTSQHTTFVLTETQPFYYNPPGGGGYDQNNRITVAGWHTLCGMTIGYFHRNLRAFIWFTLGNYAGKPWPIGLFNATAAAPNAWTNQLACFFKLVADTGATAFMFTPGKINYTVTGLPAGSWANSGGSLHWCQTSNGDFWGLLQNEQNQLSGTTSTVHIAFGTNCTLIEDYTITGAAGTQQSRVAPLRTRLVNANAINVVLGTEFRVIRVRKI